MLAAILKTNNSSTESDHWEIVEDEAFIVRYSGSDIVVGYTREELRSKLEERYPAEEHYQRVFSAGYNELSFECHAEGRLQNSPEALEVAKAKAKAGATVKLGALGWNVYDQDNAVHGDGNLTAVFDGFVLDHNKGEYLLRYDPEAHQAIKRNAERLERRRRERTGKRTEWHLTESVRKGQISCWTLHQFLEALRQHITSQPVCKGALWNCSRMWYYGGKPVRLSRVYILFSLLEILKRLSGKPHAYRNAGILTTYYEKAMLRLLDEAEAALPKMKQAIRKFDKDWKRFSFVTGAHFDDSKREEAREARRIMSKFVKWLEIELEHSSRGARRRSSVHVQRRGQRQV